RNDQRLIATVLQREFLQFPALAANDSPVERGIDSHQPRRLSRLRNTYSRDPRRRRWRHWRRRCPRRGIDRVCRRGFARGRLGLGWWSARKEVLERPRVPDEERDRQHDDQEGSSFHYCDWPLGRGGGS